MTIDRKQQSALLRHARSLFNEGTLSGLTDAELLERFVDQRGDRSELAFSVLLERHARMVLAACRRVLGNPQDVQDAFQATFLVLVRNARSIRNRQSVAGWLQSVAYRVACSVRSAASRNRFHERCYAEQAREAFAGEAHPDADLKAVLDQELSLLPECQRTVLVLCDLEGLTYDQAAQSLGWPMGTVKSRLARGRNRLRSRLIRRGVAPSLAIVREIGLRTARASVPEFLLQSTVNAVIAARLSQFTAITISPVVLKLTEGAMMSMLLTKARMSLVAVAVGSCLVATTALFVGRGLSATSQQTRDDKSSLDGERKHGTNLSLQRGSGKPWETVVRIRVQADGSVRFASGTVIQSTREESMILTCARICRPDELLAERVDHSPGKIMVDLFDGKLQGENPAQVKFDVTTGGSVVDCDLSRDVGLIRIRPGRELSASRVVPKRWQPRSGMKVLTMGCSEGNDATGWHTTITNPRMNGLSGNKLYEAIECKIAPKQGRMGGGLFTTDGYLAGVCNFAEPRGDVGLYACPQSIYLLLDRNGLSSIYEDRSTEPAEANLGEFVYEDDHPAQPLAQPNTLEELRDKLWRTTTQNEVLSAEVLRLRNQLSFYHDALQVSAAARTSRSVEGTKKPTDAKEPPAARATSPGSVAGSRREPYLRSGGLIFAASPMGNKVVAYNPMTRKEQAILLNATRENPLEVSFKDFDEVVGLHLKGSRITRTAAYDHRTAAWIPLDLSEPVSGELQARMTGDGAVIYDAGRHHYTYSSQTGKWDHFDLGTIMDTQEEGTGAVKHP